jgi:hypothetical protein
MPYRGSRLVWDAYRALGKVFCESFGETADFYFSAIKSTISVSKKHKYN